MIQLAGHPKEGTITFVAVDAGRSFFLKEFEIRAVCLVTAPALDASASMVRQVIAIKILSRT